MVVKLELTTPFTPEIVEKVTSGAPVELMSSERSLAEWLTFVFTYANKTTEFYELVFTVLLAESTNLSFYETVVATLANTAALGTPNDTLILDRAGAVLNQLERKKDTRLPMKKAAACLKGWLEVQRT